MLWRSTFLSGLAFLTMGSRYQLLEPMVTTEFTVLGLACSRPGSWTALPQVLGPPELTTYKTFGPYSIQKISLIRGVLPPYMLCSPTIAIRCETKPQQYWSIDLGPRPVCPVWCKCEWMSDRHPINSPRRPHTSVPWLQQCCKWCLPGRLIVVLNYCHLVTNWSCFVKLLLSLSLVV